MEIEYAHPSTIAKTKMEVVRYAKPDNPDAASGILCSGYAESENPYAESDIEGRGA